MVSVEVVSIIVSALILNFFQAVSIFVVTKGAPVGVVLIAVTYSSKFETLWMKLRSDCTCPLIITVLMTTEFGCLFVDVATEF